MLELLAKRAAIRKEEAASADAIIKEASPGKLKDRHKWDIWFPALENMLSLLIGAMGFPLLYVIRSLETPADTAVFGTFVQECNASLPIKWSSFLGQCKAGPPTCAISCARRGCQEMDPQA